MASFAFVAVAVLAAPAMATEMLRGNASIPITQTVTIDGVEVYSQSSGHGILNQCVGFARDAVNDPARPSITVCGTGTKVTVYLRNNCQGYHHYKEEIGTCNSGAGSTSCMTASPSTVTWMQTAQS